MKFLKIHIVFILIFSLLYTNSFFVIFFHKCKESKKVDVHLLAKHSHTSSVESQCCSHEHSCCQLPYSSNGNCDLTNDSLFPILKSLEQCCSKDKLIAKINILIYSKENPIEKFTSYKSHVRLILFHLVKNSNNKPSIIVNNLDLPPPILVLLEFIGHSSSTKTDDPLLI